jgi:hypothetical protein
MQERRMRGPGHVPFVVLLSMLVSLTAAAGCAHADSFEDGVLRKGDLHVAFGPVPSGWRRLPSSDASGVAGADLAFRDDAHDGSVLFDVRCKNRDDDAPLAILTEHLIMGTTSREFESQQVFPFDGREAMRSILRAKLDGVPLQYDILVMKKDGCLYDLVYVAPPPRFAEGDADFDRFALGLQAGARTVGPAAQASGSP